MLKALGQDGAKVATSRAVDGSARLVNADPVVGGLPTHGWATELRIARDGRPVAGNGMLKPLAKGAVYPVMGAAEALAALNEDARTTGPAGVGRCPEGGSGVPDGAGGAGGPGGSGPVDGAGRVDGSGKSGSGGTDGGIAPDSPCRKVAGTAPPEQVPVTGAVFGLAAREVAGERLLVPSWLFTADPVDGPPYTVAGTAVTPERLARSAEPGDGTAPARRIQSYRVEEGGRKLSVSFSGGVCTAYTVTAEESAERVSVRIGEEPAAPDRVCVMVAREFTRTVTLAAPLGSRPVVDAASGEAVPGR
ncbi:hypothetical protein BU196_27165 [Streptomyces sp. CBMA370]|nr:hypothetical protein [Streptomyces sp. CBMA370]